MDFSDLPLTNCPLDRTLIHLISREAIDVPRDERVRLSFIEIAYHLREEGTTRFLGAHSLLEDSHDLAFASLLPQPLDILLRPRALVVDARLLVAGVVRGFSEIDDCGHGKIFGKYIFLISIGYAL